MKNSIIGGEIDMITEYQCDKCKQIKRENYTRRYDRELERDVEYCIKCSIDYEIADLEDSVKFCRKEIEDSKQGLNEAINKIYQICNGNLESINFETIGTNPMTETKHEKTI
jgi:hypothetical protein